ncbi:MAG: carboxypeptidase-like regulatory domain-containing protein [Planctomycetaceae bacterium]|nr:carboxypeptidase-like regulatory domain-containing protein [Planctomycetaceae bacterium]
MKILSLRKCFVIVVLPFLMFVSCGGEPIPQGMPKLYPAKVTIVQAGKKLDGATVTLYNNDNPQSQWVVGGLTDSNGVCTLKTLGKFNGAPAGKYKVAVEKITITGKVTSKQPDMSDTKALEEYYEKKNNEKYYNNVNLKYKLLTTTDLEIEIITGKNEKTFDVGEPINEEIILVK